MVSVSLGDRQLDYRWSPADDATPLCGIVEEHDVDVHQGYQGRQWSGDKFNWISQRINFTEVKQLYRDVSIWRARRTQGIL